MKCPVCPDATLHRALTTQGVAIDQCPACRGVWLGRGEIFLFATKARSIAAKLERSLADQSPSDRLSPAAGERQVVDRTVDVAGPEPRPFAGGQRDLHEVARGRAVERVERATQVDGAVRARRDRVDLAVGLGGEGSVDRTGRGVEGEDVGLGELGADATFVKPLDRSEFLKTVASLTVMS